eukprot:1934475-Amphidinium_carterae.2
MPTISAICGTTVPPLTNLKGRFRQHLRWLLKRRIDPAQPQMSVAGHEAKPQDVHAASAQPEARKTGPPWLSALSEASQQTVRVNFVRFMLRST